MWELDYKESWAPKNWCFWTVALEKTLASPLDCKWPKQSILEEISPQCSLEGLMLKLKPLNVKNWLTGKDPDAGKDPRQEEKGTTEDEIVGWQNRLKGHDWVNSGSWRWTGRPGVLCFMGSQRVEHHWATELKGKTCLKKHSFRIPRRSQTSRVVFKV